MEQIDLNSDLGESFGPWVMGSDAEMMEIVTSANIACGGHAGDAKTMLDTISIAREKGVAVGAHPGFVDKEGFGRRQLPLNPEEVSGLIATQVGAIKGVAGLVGADVTYVKAHGALSNWAAVDALAAEAIARTIKTAFPECALLAVSGTELEKAGLKYGVDTYSEIFADRAYGDDGNLVPRSVEGSVLHDAGAACARLEQFFTTGKMPTITGGAVSLNAHSICIHGDNPAAVAMGRQVRETLAALGIKLAPFVAG